MDQEHNINIKYEEGFKEFDTNIENFKKFMSNKKREGKSEEEWLQEIRTEIYLIPKRSAYTMSIQDFRKKKKDLVDEYVAKKRINPSLGEGIKEIIDKIQYKMIYDDEKEPKKKTLNEMMIEESSENYEFQNRLTQARIEKKNQKEEPKKYFDGKLQQKIDLSVFKTENKKIADNLKKYFAKKEDQKEKKKKGKKGSRNQNKVIKSPPQKTETNSDRSSTPNSINSARMTTRSMTKALLQNKGKQGNFTEEVEEIIKRTNSDPIRNFTKTETFYDKAKKYFDTAKDVVRTIDTAAKIYAYGMVAGNIIYHGYNMINMRRYARNNNLPPGPGPI